MCGFTIYFQLWEFLESTLFGFSPITLFWRHVLETVIVLSEPVIVLSEPMMNGSTSPDL